MMLRTLLLAFTCATSTFVPAAAAETRIKDVTSVRGIRTNHLIGYGLVIGLNGTGDSLRNAPFTQQSMQSMLERMGVNIRGVQAKTRNVAAVMIMAELPAFASRGNSIDVTVASLGDATSLHGGSLLMTPLAGADETIYAVAQGQLAVSAMTASGRNESVTRGVPTSGRIPNGAMVERDAPGSFDNNAGLALELRNPDFKTAVTVSDAINAFAKQHYHRNVAATQDMRTITLQLPRGISTSRFMSDIGDIKVIVDVPARIVVDERTGTIVIGQDVQIAPVAVAYGDVVVRVTETPRVSQPLPFSKGQTTVVSDTAVGVDERGGAMHLVRGPKLQTIVTALNRMGLKPSGIIAVLQAIKSAGALNAELIVQ